MRRAAGVGTRDEVRYGGLLAAMALTALFSVACASPSTMRVVLSGSSGVFVEQTVGGQSALYRCGPDGADCEPSELAALVRATREEAQRASESPTRSRDWVQATQLAAPGEEADCEDCGFISLRSYPYCALRIDGERAGVTPVIRLSLTEGVHRIECETRSGRSEEFDVVVRPREHERLLIAVHE